MKNILEQLTDLLKKDERLVSQDGVLLKNHTQELARKNDPALIKLLLSDNAIKQHFFFEVEKTLIFDKEKFIRFVSNKRFLPDSYTAFKNKIGLTASDEYVSESKEVVLAWPYKDCVLEGGMTKEDKKQDYFFKNKTLAPDDINRLLDAKVFTNFKRIDKKGAHKLDGFNRDEKGTIKDNLIIKGNNLLALASLKKKFAGKVKSIYIDPPYNTGGSAETFTYNNSFNHSTWLTFMKNRLELAKTLLRDDGFIAIAIDHVELFYLGSIADDIFGRNNRMGIISVVHQARGRWMDKNFSASNEFMLVYSKRFGTDIRNVVIDPEKKEKFDLKDEKGIYYLKNYIVIQGGGGGVTRKDKPNFWYPIYVSKDLKKVSLEKIAGYEEVLPITDSGRELTWITIPETFLERFSDGEVEIKREKGKIVIYRKFREQQIIPTHWFDSRYNATSHGTLLLEKIVGHKNFSYPKSLFTVLDTLKLMTENDDIVMDFFAGSGTTAHATLELNKEDGGKRSFILIEQLQEHFDICKERIIEIIKKGNLSTSFVSLELAQWNEEWVEKIRDAKTEKELVKIWGEMKETAFLSYKIEPKTIDANAKDFADLSLADQKKFLIECLDKNQLYVNLSEIEDKEYGVNKDDIELNKEFYEAKS